MDKILLQVLKEVFSYVLPAHISWLNNSLNRDSLKHLNRLKDFGFVRVIGSEQLDGVISVANHFIVSIEGKKYLLASDLERAVIEAQIYKKGRNK